MSKEIETTIEIGVDLMKDVVFGAWRALQGYTTAQYQKNDPFGIATREYIRGLIERYNLVKVLGMREPVPLKKLYVRANILEKISAHTGLSPEELSRFFDLDQRTFGKKSTTVAGEIIVNKLERFIVLGKPGAGKTTYLRFLTLMMLDKQSQIEQRRLPVFVTLREWADEKIPLADFIAQQFHICGFEQAEAFVEKMLVQGRCIVLFDGLDEVSGDANQDDILRQIRNFTDKYSDNQFVISCRVAAYNTTFERFTDVEMADFNAAQMEAFIRNWFHGEPKVATECWERLNSSPPLRELASVPLLLTLLCLEYGESNDFPPNRAELYERAIETLLTKWDSSRRIRRAEVYKQLSIKRKESMFARIAYGTFSTNEYFVRERSLAGMIEKYIEHLPGFNPAELEPDSRAVLHAIAAQHGIFVERAKGVYSFAHLTFQEYFTAKYIVDNQGKKVNEHGVLADDGKITLLEFVVEKHLYESKWKEVFKLIAGMLDNADELLLLIRQKGNEVLEITEVNALFKMASAALLPIENKYNPVIRRGGAIILAMDLKQHIDRDINLDIDIFLARDRNLNRAQNLDVEKIFYINLQIAQNITRKITKNISWGIARNQDISAIYGRFNFQDRARDLSLDYRLIEKYFETYPKITTQVAQLITNYIEANQLILRCLSTGCYVSNPVRERMIHDIFLPKASA